VIDVLVACLLSGPPQVTLPACPCKPCHCSGDCACAGGICSCAGCGLSLEEAATLAAQRKLPLVVWVGGHEHDSLRKRLPAAVHVRVATWKGSKAPGVVVAPLVNGWPCARGVVPARHADLATVLDVLGGGWWQKPQPSVSVRFAPVAARAAGC
jgi:hypothetical protein